MRMEMDEEKIDNFHRKANKEAMDICFSLVKKGYPLNLTALIICECMACILALAPEDYEKTRQGFQEYLSNPRLKEWVTIIEKALSIRTQEKENE